MNVLHSIGMYGAIGVNLYGITQLWETPTALSVFVLFILANELFNRFLKTMIREERPSELISDKTDSAYYGMPSGHSQHIFFSAMYLQLQPVQYSELIWVIALITMYERVANHKHTIRQVVVGAVFGLGMGYLAHQLIPA
jgi:membrane-associated phospholipid phosphatase